MSNDQTKEQGIQRRKSPRVDVNWPASVTTGPTSSISGVITDASRTGLTLVGKVRIQLGKSCSIRVEVNDGVSNAVMYVDAVVMTCLEMGGGNYRLGLFMVSREGFGVKLFEKFMTQEDQKRSGA